MTASNVTSITEAKARKAQGKVAKLIAKHGGSAERAWGERMYGDQKVPMYEARMWIAALGKEQAKQIRRAA